jgi:hypothetical protein
VTGPKGVGVVIVVSAPSGPTVIVYTPVSIKLSVVALDGI